MVLARVHYRENNALERLQAAFCLLEQEFSRQAPIILCIGTDKDILDCLGPMAGTMLAEKRPDVRVVGCLDEPVTAKNVGFAAARLRISHPESPIMAVDASVSLNETAGTVLFKAGSLLPGKALNKRLPPVGDYALTGIVEQRNGEPKSVRSVSAVYHMACLISESLAGWMV